MYSQSREFGRQYVIKWHAVDARFIVTLGATVVGSHQKHEGACELAKRDSERSTLIAIEQPSCIKTANGNV